MSVGALVRNQVATLVGLCAWIFLVESVSKASFRRRQADAGGAGLSLAGNEHKLSIAIAAVLLVTYTAAAAAAGWATTLRRDVT